MTPKADGTNILDVIRGWQIRARDIAPPEGSEIIPVRGGLPGPAFFPEGFGLQNPTSDAMWPHIMAIGHNFGCESYRNEIDAAGREDDKATWRNLHGLLNDAGVAIESCFMTNWFIGLQPGDKQVGVFLSRPDSRYERECSDLLLEEMQILRPSIVLLLGLSIVGRAHQIMPILKPWANASNWSEVDSSSLGAVAYGLDIPGAEIKTNVVALLHPSFSPSNQRHRRATFPVEKPEVAMVRSALAAEKSPDRLVFQEAD